MTWWSWELLNKELSRRTPVFGIHLWMLIAAGGAAALILTLLVVLLFSLRRRPRHHPSLSSLPTSTNTAKKSRNSENRKNKPLVMHLHDPTPPVSKEISVLEYRRTLDPPAERRIDVGKPQIAPDVISPLRSTITGSGTAGSRSSEQQPDVSHLGWGRRYTLRELEEATDGLAEENVIGEGGYGVVYRGQLGDGTIVAVKNLLNNRGQAEKEFRGEVEVIGRVRHKNLVRLLGYCMEEGHRMLVYEYVDNGNLDLWLHGEIGEVSPMTWEIRMNIILGAARGLAYLHEGLEPKVVHRDVKSSNILLDRQWNPKVSDFGLAKLLCSERSYVTTRVMGTFGYVAPEYASTGMLNETSDVYSFGVLIMEIITGRTPADYTRPHGEVNLVEWLKTMVGERKSEQVLDPKMEEKPGAKALKRTLLVALRCVDPDASKRPKMSHIIHMLEADDLLGRDILEQKKPQEISNFAGNYQQKLSNKYQPEKECNTDLETPWR